MKQDIETMITMNDKNLIAHCRVILLLAVLCFALASCENRDYLRLPDGPEGPPIENPGRLHLSGIPAAHTAMLLDPAQGNRLVANITAELPVDVEAGTYTLLYVSPAKSASARSSSTGGANLRSDAGSAIDTDYSLDGLLLSLPLLTADGRLPQLPDVYTDGASITIRREQTHTVSLTPAPLTRAVQLDVVLQGTDMENIRSIEARLYGVSRTAQLDQGFAPQTRNAEERQVFYISCPLIADSGSTTTAAPTMSGIFRLTGIAPDTPQRIVIITTQTDDNVTTFEQDVSALFVSFNPPAAATTLRLTATLSFGIDEITGTINPWKPGWNEGGTGI